VGAERPNDDNKFTGESAGENLVKNCTEIVFET